MLRMVRTFAGSAGDEDEAPIQGPNTSSDYVLRAVFIRFAAAAEGKVESFLRESLSSCKTGFKMTSLSCPESMCAGTNGKPKVLKSRRNLKTLVKSKQYAVPAFHTPID
ncbi:hypothetical protein CONPUDRAFT_148153 [Coniophora puteana RWD-64-598 SS2]|uniref:Uncharacterized protein n=1 Tax=Coniophora puteana (strain RWD-64-598) TaxID=741705 RepID=A0A5M3N3Q3_CONPW|nr:uncharacterized protein CONPUDRAFT_148153 [Coniophora puteana RWD-64-598 SS2]EIW86030.1 hypothetical protein CONPUDRAFT_148153 [Coniophora puteana RWD-64-598 SS2]